MSSCADGKEYKDSPTEGTREPEEGPKKKKPKEGKAGGQDESPLPSEDPERELVCYPHKYQVKHKNAQPLRDKHILNMN